MNLDSARRRLPLAVLLPPALLRRWCPALRLIHRSGRTTALRHRGGPGEAPRRGLPPWLGRTRRSYGWRRPPHTDGRRALRGQERHLRAVHRWSSPRMAPHQEQQQRAHGKPRAIEPPAQIGPFWCLRALPYETRVGTSPGASAERPVITTRVGAGPRTGHTHRPGQVDQGHAVNLESQISDHLNGDLYGSQADSAGSIPVTRSKRPGARVRRDSVLATMGPRPQRSPGVRPCGGGRS